MGSVYLYIALAAFQFGGFFKSCHATTCATDGSSASVNVTAASLDGRAMWRVQSSGCYPWNPPKQQTTPNTPTVTALDVCFPKTPVISSTPAYVGRRNLSVKGPIGITLSGVAIYGDGDAQGRPAYTYEGATMDSCNGHADPSGVYHLHTLPGGCCAYPAETGTQHSPFWAVMADGIPVAGPVGDNGTTPSDLDECRGHTDATYSFYHYHVTSIIEDPYIVGCLKGCVFQNFGNFQLSQLVNSNCVPTATQYNYLSLNMTWSAAPVSTARISGCPYTYSPKLLGNATSTSPPLPPPSEAVVASTPYVAACICLSLYILVLF